MFRLLVICLVIFAAVISPYSSYAAFTLITFDVDGTLVQGSGRAADTSAHARAFSHAVGKVLSPISHDTNTDKKQPVKPVAEALPRELYHGSTDGLILLRLARATLGIEPEDAFPQLDALMTAMYSYISSLTDEEIAEGIRPLPKVIETFQQLSTMKDRVMCGLVTGNVEGVARRKMRAVGIFQTQALARPAVEQTMRQQWKGSEDIAFLGGFGSDFCSGEIDNPDRNHLDRSQQIEIAANRCRQILASAKISHGEDNTALKRVVHVGDAPADVLAAKAYAERIAMKNVSDLCVGMVATATGSYSAQELRELAGESIPGRWECVVLEDGIADPRFFKACGL